MPKHNAYITETVIMQNPWFQDLLFFFFFLNQFLANKRIEITEVEFGPVWARPLRWNCQAYPKTSNHRIFSTVSMSNRNNKKEIKQRPIEVNGTFQITLLCILQWNLLVTLILQLPNSFHHKGSWNLFKQKCLHLNGL